MPKSKKRKVKKNDVVKVVSSGFCCLSLTDEQLDQAARESVIATAYLNPTTLDGLRKAMRIRDKALIDAMKKMGVRDDDIITIDEIESVKLSNLNWREEARKLEYEDRRKKENTGDCQRKVQWNVSE